MPFSNATQPQMETLLARLRLLTQAVHTGSQGSYPAPLEPNNRILYANLASQLATILQELEVLGEHGALLGPNDVIVDKTLPVTVFDSATGGKLSGASGPASDGNVISFDVKDDTRGAIVMDGFQVGVRSDKVAADHSKGTLVFLGHSPSYVQLADGCAVVKGGENLRMTIRGGSQSITGTVGQGPTGLLAAVLPDGHGFASANQTVSVLYGNSPARPRGIQATVQLESTNLLKGVAVPSNVALMVSGEAYVIGGVTYKFTVVNGLPTAIDIVP